MAASEPCARPKPAFVYMVRCTGGQLYTGWTTDPAARLQAHKSGRGARYTRARGAAAFAYVERCADKRSALRREAALKKLPKVQKELLCRAWSAAGGPFSGA
ncbi:GIY-YIG nuclease family protein [Faecalibacterium taiwanense]|uniref:GIY-YIG nuclease family protein n=1 Tax=Faecalibacterium taiwanense TaxID=3030638 RepID=UPI003AB014E2